MARRRLSAVVPQWAEATKFQQENTFKGAVQKLERFLYVNTVDSVSPPNAGAVPVDTGNLRRSLIASTASMPHVDSVAREYPDPSASNAMTIEGADVGDTIYLGYQAAYAPRIQYGFVGTDDMGRTYNQAGRHWIEPAEDRWQSFVTEAAREVGLK